MLSIETSQTALWTQYVLFFFQPNKFCLQDALPGVKIHKQKQSLHRDDIYPLAVRSGHSQNFQVGEAQDYEAERKAAEVEEHRKGPVGGQLRPLLPVQVNGTRGVSVAVSSPVHQHLGQRKGERVQPGVGQNQKSVPVAHLAGVT